MVSKDTKGGCQFLSGIDMTNLFLSLLKEARNYSQSIGCAKSLCSATKERAELLSSEDASTPDSLDLLFRHPAEEPGDQVHDENRLPGHKVQPGFDSSHKYGPSCEAHLLFQILLHKTILMR